MCFSLQRHLSETHQRSRRTPSEIQWAVEGEPAVLSKHHQNLLWHGEPPHQPPRQRASFHRLQRPFLLQARVCSSAACWPDEGGEPQRVPVDEAAAAGPPGSALLFCLSDDGAQQHQSFWCCRCGRGQCWKSIDDHPETSSFPLHRSLWVCEDLTSEAAIKQFCRAHHWRVYVCVSDFALVPLWAASFEVNSWSGTLLTVKQEVFYYPNTCKSYSLSIFLRFSSN